MGHRRRLSSLVLIVLTMATACAPQAPAAPPTAAPAQPAAAAQPTVAKPAGSEASRTLTLAYTASDPSTMDPGIGNESQANIIVLAAYEPLVAYKHGTTEIAPKLATEWKLSDDGKAYTFKLRPNVKFSDGTPLTAEAVKLSFDRLAGMGKGPAFVLAGIYDRVDVVDPLTVNVVLKSPVGHFLSMLPKAFVVNPRFVQEHATPDDKWAEKYLYDHVNGTGPFDVERWDHNSQVVFVRKNNYWGLPDRPKIERAVLRVIPDPSTARLLLEKGDLDLWGTGIPLDAVAQLKSNPNLVVAEDETIVSLYLQVSQVRSPLDDPRVRRAVALAFDY